MMPVQACYRYDPASVRAVAREKHASPDMTRSRLGARIIIQHLRVSGFHRSMGTHLLQVTTHDVKSISVMTCER